jgi:hypothetical protein
VLKGGGSLRGWALSPHQAAIDRDYRTGHIVGQIGRQELDDLGAILDRPKPPKGDQLGPIAIALTMTADAKSNAWFSSLRLFS